MGNKKVKIGQISVLSSEDLGILIPGSPDHGCQIC